MNKEVFSSMLAAVAIGCIFALLVSVITMALFVDATANSLQARFSNLDIECSKEFNPKAAAINIDGSFLYCSYQDRREKTTEINLEEVIQ